MEHQSGEGAQRLWLHPHYDGKNIQTTIWGQKPNWPPCFTVGRWSSKDCSNYCCSSTPVLKGTLHQAPIKVFKMQNWFIFGKTMNSTDSTYISVMQLIFSYGCKKWHFAMVLWVCHSGQILEYGLDFWRDE